MEEVGSHMSTLHFRNRERFPDWDTFVTKLKEKAVELGHELK